MSDAGRCDNTAGDPHNDPLAGIDELLVTLREALLLCFVIGGAVLAVLLVAVLR